MALQPGTMLHGGSYRIIRFIGQGGFGCTYEIEHVTMGRRMAMKEFFIDSMCNRDATGYVTVGTSSQVAFVEKLRHKFIKEARCVNALNHPGIVRVTDVFEENGTAYFVMDYIEGQSLQSMIKTYGPVPESHAVAYIRQVCDALEYVHSKHMLHLDVKPDNIMVDGDGRAILIDFGVSKQYDEESGQNTSTIVGHSQGYSPLEQASNKLRNFTPATDVYALGATLYALLTGHAPIDSSELAMGEPLPPLPASVSPAVRNAIYQAMQPSPANRPQSIAEFRQLLSSDSQKPATNIAAKPNAGNATLPYVANPQAETKDIASTIPVSTTPKSDNSSGRYDFEDEPTSRPWKKYAIVAAVVAIIVGLAFVVWPANNEEPSNEESSAFASTVTTLPNGNQRFTVNGVSFDMVNVDGGTFTMGATAEQGNDIYDDEKPAHQVTLGSYSIGETEVTQELWEAVMGSNPSFFKGSKKPVECVSWIDCQEFISRLNQMTGQQFRLPTEAEWEFAARGGNRSQNTKYSCSNNINDVAWYGEDWDSGATHDVKGKNPNQLGIYDMSGNVWEWCSDWYGAYSSNSQSNPKGPAKGCLQVLRGGSWGSNARGCRVSDRGGSTPSDRMRYYGLRLAL